MGRTVRRTEQGLEHEEVGKRRQALLRGLGFNDEPKTVKSAKELSQEEDEEVLGRGEAVQKFDGDVELHELGLTRCAVRGERGVHEHGESATEKLEEPQESP